MKIAMIGQKGMPTQYGGVEKHVQELSIRIAATSPHEVIVYTRPWYTSAQKTKYRGVRLVSLPSIKTKHFDAISHTFLSILHASFKERVDIIHIHAVGPALLTWLARIVQPRAKVIVTFHCIDRQHQKWNLFAKFMLWLGEWSAMKFAHQVVSVSQTLQNYAYEVYKRSTEYIPNGIEPVQPQPASMISRQFDLEENGYIAVIARLVRHKGVHYLIDAYKRLDTTKKLVIVGGSAFTDDYVEELKHQAGDDPNIVFTGNQTGQMLAELFSNAYCYVLPSESEGLPIALLEAASYGKAILASDIPANVEIVQHCGLTFKNGNVNDLAEKLRTLLDHPELVEETGKQARKYVLEHYLWDSIAVDTIRLYDKTVEHKSAIQPKLAEA